MFLEINEHLWVKETAGKQKWEDSLEIATVFSSFCPFMRQLTIKGNICIRGRNFTTILFGMVNIYKKYYFSFS